jgi:hypothetical protein
VRSGVGTAPTSGLIFLMLLLSATAGAEDTVLRGRVEVVLADQYRKELPALKKDFRDAGLPNVHIQFTRSGQPPPNIGLGRQIPADVARAAIRLALKYNREVKVLLPHYLFPPMFITIASSNFDDTVEFSIDEDMLTRLLDPSLGTEDFHKLYRQFTTVKR